MSNMNVVVFAGRLTRDPEIRFIERNGEERAVANFGLAINRGYGDKETADFFECSVWGKQAESLVNYKKKGDAILIRGEARYRTWEDGEGNKRSAVSFEAYQIQFLGSKGEGGGGGQQQGKAKAQDDVDLNEEDFDDIPF